MTTTRQDEHTLASIKELNARFESATGHAAYLYSTAPGSTTYYVFADGSRISQGNAEGYMRGLLGRAFDDPEGDWRWWS